MWGKAPQQQSYSSNRMMAECFGTATPVKPCWQNPHSLSKTSPVLKPSSGSDIAALQQKRLVFTHTGFQSSKESCGRWEGVYLCLHNKHNMQNLWSPKRLFQLLFPVWVSLVLQRQSHGDAEVHSSPQFISGLSQHTAPALCSSLIIYCILLADLIVFCPVLESCMDGFRKKSMCPDQQAFLPQHRGISKVPPFLLFICFL